MTTHDNLHHDLGHGTTPGPRAMRGNYSAYGPLQDSLALIRAGIPSTEDLVRVRDEITRLAAQITGSTPHADGGPVVAVSGPVDPYAPRWLSGSRAHVVWWLGSVRHAIALSDLVRPHSMTGQMFLCGSWRDVCDDIRYDLQQMRRRGGFRRGVRWLAEDLRFSFRRGYYVAVPVAELPTILDGLTVEAGRVAE